MEQFVIKCTREDGSTYLAYDGLKFDRERAECEVKSCTRIHGGAGYKFEMVPADQHS